MTFKFSVCLLPLLVLATLPFLADAACGQKQCGTCTGATSTAGGKCLWCSLQFKKTPTTGKATFVNSGLGFCFDGTTCPTAAAKVASLTKSFPYKGQSKATHDLEINSVVKADCANNLGASVDATKDSPLDASKAQCKDCTGTKEWCQFDQFLKGTLYSGKSGGVCLDAASGKTYSVDCSKFKAMITTSDDLEIAKVDTSTASSTSANCPRIDTPTCTADNCRGCLRNRCTYCATVVRSITTSTTGVKTTSYENKALGVCKPMGTECPTSFGTLWTVTDYTHGPMSGGTRDHKMEVMPYGTLSIQTPHYCSTRKVDRSADLKSNCRDCVTTGSNPYDPHKWCKVEMYTPTGNISGGFCIGKSQTTTCGDFSSADADFEHRTEISSISSNCPPPPCGTYTKCSSCTAAAAGCDWCAAKVGTNDIKLGYCVEKGTSTTKCDKTKFGSLDGLLKAAGKTFTVAQTKRKGAGFCKSTTKDSPLVMASKACDACAPGNTWCNLGDGTNSGGVCLLKTARTATHSTDCATLKTSLSMSTALDITAASNCPPPACGTYTKCSRCTAAAAGCDWCAAKVGTNDFNLGYCEKKGTPTTCDKTKFGSLDGLFSTPGGKTFTVAPNATCPTPKTSPLISASKTCKTCAPANSWCILDNGTNSGGVCLKLYATTATHSTNCGTLKTSLNMSDYTSVMEASECPHPACHTYTKCSDCTAAAAGCDWCAAKVGTNDIKLGYCEKKGTSTTTCDKTKFGSLDGLLKAAAAAGKTFTVAPKTAATCPSTKYSPLVMASKTCNACVAGNAWCKLDNGTNSGGVCLLKTATAATHSTVCATLKTPLGMTTATPVTSCGGAPKTCDCCDSHTKCSDCKAAAGCDWCGAKVGTNDINLGYCTKQGAACDKTKFGLFDDIIQRGGKKLDVSPLDTKACPAASPIQTAKVCTACTEDCNLILQTVYKALI